MRIENAVGAEVLERMLSAYGFTMQKELAEHLGIAKSNVAGWVQRGQVPGNAIVQCVLDTGANLSWLITGEFEKANLSLDSISNVKGKILYQEVMANGGKPVLRRILDAYGFTMQKQLCDLLDISSGTVSTWIRRNYFPGDVVVTCALDTGASLKWLATGKGSSEVRPTENHINTIKKKFLNAGGLEDAGEWAADLSFLPEKPLAPLFVSSKSGSWLVDNGINDISNGCWLLSIDKKFDIYNVSILPGKKINVKNALSDFICGNEEVDVAGKVVITMEYNF